MWMMLIAHRATAIAGCTCSAYLLVLGGHVELLDVCPWRPGRRFGLGSSLLEAHTTIATPVIWLPSLLFESRQNFADRTQRCLEI